MKFVIMLMIGMLLFGIAWLLFEKKRNIWKSLVGYVENCKEKTIYITLFILTIVSQGWMVCLRSLPVSADEIYSMSGASFFAGYDWSAYMQLKKFYNFGYTMLLSPLYKLFDDPVSIYRAMLFCNIIVHALIVVTVYGILRSKLKCSKIFSIAVTLVSTCNAIVIFFRGYMYNEMPLAIIVWLSLLILLTLSESTGKGRIWLSVILAVLVAYAYIIHSRCIIVYAALAVLVLIYLLVYRKWLVQPVAFAVVFAPCLYLESKLLDYVQENLYLQGTEVVMQNSVEHVVTGTWRYRAFTSLEGIGDLIARFFSLAGAMTIKTGGILTIVTVVVLYYVVKYFKKIRQGKENKQLFILLVFSLISLWGMVFAVAITGAANGKIRFLAYTRYFMPFIGPFLLTGLLIMKKTKELNYKWIVSWSAVITLIVGVVYVFYTFPILNQQSMKEITSFNLFMPFAWYDGQQKFTKNVFMVALGLLVVFTIGLLFLYRRKQLVAICTVVVIFSSALIWQTEKIQGSPSSNRRINTVDAASELLEKEELQSREIYCIGTDPYRRTLMFACYDNNNIVYKRKQMEFDEDTVVVTNDINELLSRDPQYVYQMDKNEWVGIWDDELKSMLDALYEIY